MKSEILGQNRNPAVALLCVAIATVVFCSVFLWNPPAPRFYPMERVWRMPNEPAPGAAMGWYGRTGAALGAATVAGGLAAVGLRDRDRSRRIELKPIAIYAIAFVLAACVACTFAGIVFEQRPWFTKAPTVPKPDHEY